MYRDQRRRPDQQRDPSAKGSRFRIGTILVIGAAAAFALFQANGKSGPRKPPPPEALGSVSAKRVTDHVADLSVVGGALAAEKALADKKLAKSGGKVTVRANGREVVVRPGEVAANGVVQRQAPVIYTPVAPTVDANPRAIRMSGIRSLDSHETPEAAKEDALLQAREKLREQLALLEPPISHVPSVTTIRENLMRPGSLKLIEPSPADREAWAAANLDPNRVWASVDLDIGEEGLRGLRGEGRLRDAGRWGGILLVVAGMVFAYLKLDGLSKGWLSVGLGVAAILTAGTLIAGLFVAL